MRWFVGVVVSPGDIGKVNLMKVLPYLRYSVMFQVLIFLNRNTIFFESLHFSLNKVNIRWIYNKIFIDCRSYRSLFWFTNPRNWKFWHFYINCQILSYFFFYRMQKFGYHFKNHKLIYVRNTPEEFPMLLKFRALLSSNYSQ